VGILATDRPSGLFGERLLADQASVHCRREGAVSFVEPDYLRSFEGFLAWKCDAHQSVALEPAGIIVWPYPFSGATAFFDLAGSPSAEVGGAPQGAIAPNPAEHSGRISARHFPPDVAAEIYSIASFHHT
jgi:hypothetical protein